MNSFCSLLVIAIIWTSKESTWLKLLALPTALLITNSNYIVYHYRLIFMNRAFDKNWIDYLLGSDTKNLDRPKLIRWRNMGGQHFRVVPTPISMSPYETLCHWVRLTPRGGTGENQISGCLFIHIHFEV